MNQIVIDLLQTASIIWPLIAAWVVVLGLGAFGAYWVWSFWPDGNDTKLRTLEVTQSAQQQAKLTTFYQTGDLEPTSPESVIISIETNHQSPGLLVDREDVPLDSLHRGAEVPRSDDTSIHVTHTPYSDMATTYGFETYKHYHRQELILFDTDFPGFDVKRRVVTYPIAVVVGVSASELRKVFGTARSTVNRRAQRAGLSIVKRQAGRPAREGVST